MKARLSKWGNSYGIRIPKGLIRSANLAEGDVFSITTPETGTFVLKQTRPRYKLEELVAGITPRNIHRETEWGEPQGNEVW